MDKQAEEILNVQYIDYPYGKFWAYLWLLNCPKHRLVNFMSEIPMGIRTDFIFPDFIWALEHLERMFGEYYE